MNRCLPLPPMLQRMTGGKVPMLLFFLLTCSFSSLFAQQTITGRVVDSAGLSLQGISIAVPGTSSATLTDENGSFSLSVPALPATIRISSIGFIALELNVTTGSLSAITLQREISSLDEIVVIGYGTRQKKDLTGSVATITSKDFQKGQISSPEQMIAGKVPGVSIITGGGSPGAGSTIRIRGGSSLSASNDPLIVIDGVPVDNGSIAGAGNALSFVNPNDVESFTILKDASAAAIYGTRASNGVIIITTKKGRSDALRINFSTVNSVSLVTKKVDVLSADQFRSIVNDRGTPAQVAMLGAANTDWQDEIYRPAFATDNNISITGGIKKLPYRLSLGYQNQDGILKTDNRKRSSIALAINPTFFDNHLKVDLNLKGSMQKTRFANQGAIGAATSFDPTQPVYSKSDRFGGYYEWLDPSSATGLMNLAGRNPLGLLEQRFDESEPVRSIGNLQLDYKFHFLPDLRASMNIGYDISKGEGTVFIPDSAAEGYLAGGTGGRNDNYKQTKRNTVFDFYLTYIKDLKNLRSNLDVTAGYSYLNYQITNYNYASYTARGIKYPNSDPAFPFDKPENTLISFFGRLNYTFNNKYLLTATLRRDGSSRFAPVNRWGVFPSVALAWKINEESFLVNSTAVSLLKLRLGYGATGQQDGIGNYDYLSYYALSSTNASYQFGNTYYQGFRPGGFYANRKWEETATTNLALDFGFLNNRISGSVDFYYKKTSDLLNSIPQPAGTNFTAFIVANVGDMTNKGVEFSLNAQPIRNRDLTLDLSYNITYNKNTITNLTVVPKDLNYPGFPSGTIAGGIGGQFVYINAVNESKSTFNLYSQVYDANGRPVEGVFVDFNEDGIINQDDLYKGKRADPRVFMGFSSNLSYRKWNAGFVLRASFDNYVYNNTFSQTGILNQILGNTVLYNASTNYLETGFVGNSQQLLSDYYIENASFLRMDNLSIGYNAGAVYRDKVNLRVTASVQNVFVITKYQGLDPEISSGIDNNFYPRPRIFAVGLNLEF